MTDHVGTPKRRRSARTIRLADGDVLTRCDTCRTGVRDSWLAPCPTCGRSLCIRCWPGSPRRQVPPTGPVGSCRSCEGVLAIAGIAAEELQAMDPTIATESAGRTPDDLTRSPDSGEEAVRQGQPEFPAGADQPTPTVTHSLSQAPGYACVHVMTWPEPGVTRAAALAYVEAQKFFGYHPCGYGGFLEPDQYRAPGDEPRAEWRWLHSHSCD